jgi:hypothetical protein
MIFHFNIISMKKSIDTVARSGGLHYTHRSASRLTLHTIIDIDSTVLQLTSNDNYLETFFMFTIWLSIVRVCIRSGINSYQPIPGIIDVKWPRLMRGCCQGNLAKRVTPTNPHNATGPGSKTEKSVIKLGSNLGEQHIWRQGPRNKSSSFDWCKKILRNCLQSIWPITGTIFPICGCILQLIQRHFFVNLP